MAPMGTTKTDRIRPRALEPGDTIGIAAPASAIDRDALEAGCARLRAMGYKPFYLESIFEHDLYFAGPTRRRAAELMELFERDDIRAILSARGGYGSALLLPELDVEVVRKHPKIFIAYSDATALLTWMNDAAKLVTFHGPMAAKDFAHPGGVDEASWNAALRGKAKWEVPQRCEALVPGEAEGTLYGGCLSILVASLGTPYEIHTAGKILFFEDVNTKPYQVDRMLTQLNQAEKFEGVLGVVFGEMKGCVQGPEQNYTLQQVVRRALGDLGIPVAFGLRSGHVTAGNITLPLGVRCRLRVASDASLEILEPATTRARVEAQAGPR
jgi:muramoyltetrapeptide carboxypeptidase